MPPSVERSQSHPLPEAPLIRGASTLTNSGDVYEMTRDHIDNGLPLGILIDRHGMTLSPTGETVKKGDGKLYWYALKNGRIDPHINVRSATPLPSEPEKGTILFGIPERDSAYYSGFTIVEVFSK